jgi:hypothetical protein
MNEIGSHQERQARQFTELFTAYYGPVLAYVQRRVGADLAQDVVADTFVAAWRNVRELPPDPLPWLYRAAHFSVANQRRTLARRNRLDDRARLQAADAIALDHSDQVAADLELTAAFRAIRRRRRWPVRHRPVPGARRPPRRSYRQFAQLRLHGRDVYRCPGASLRRRAACAPGQWRAPGEYRDLELRDR